MILNIFLSLLLWYTCIIYFPDTHNLPNIYFEICIYILKHVKDGECTAPTGLAAKGYGTPDGCPRKDAATSAAAAVVPCVVALLLAWAMWA